MNFIDITNNYLFKYIKMFLRSSFLTDNNSFDCIHPEKYMFPDEYEAFILNELCHFSGAFCNSLHCDELTHLCRVPYELGNLHKKEETDAAQKDVAETDRIQGKEGKGLPLDEDGYLTGSTGCGLCALYRMKQVGITHLKQVGRGNYTDFMEKDIRQLRKALDILENSDSEAQYQKKMKASLFPDGCSQFYRLAIIVHHFFQNLQFAHGTNLQSCIKFVNDKKINYKCDKRKI